jgi:hypothetical protein
MSKRTLSKVAALLSLSAIGLAAAGSAAADGAVKEADPTCTMATAVLLLGDGSDANVRWDMIRKVLATNPSWVVGTEAQRGTVGSVAMTQWNVRYPYKGGPTQAYTVQCGHGGTCNDIAKAFAKTFPQLQPGPAVVGDATAMFDSPSSVR